MWWITAQELKIPLFASGKALAIFRNFLEIPKVEGMPGIPIDDEFHNGGGGGWFLSIPRWSDFNRFK